MFQNALKDWKHVRISPTTAAGTGTVTSSTIAMDGFDSVCVIADLGPVVDAAVATLQVQDGAQSNGADAANIAGASATLTASTSSNTRMVVDVHKPQGEWITVTLGRATQNVTVYCINAILYNAKNKPVTQPATVASSTTVYANT